ncbi:hypothetical protein [Archangium sp.]|jgi:hypothetical protein|uniref:LVIVD repeat-containing protein n=1 Tax=Archangium sp. TaxID=1872627 RepID=UPI002ED8D195
MNRFFLYTTGVLLLTATGCTNTEQVEKKECQLEAFDLSACDRSGLAAVTAEGVWHLNVVLNGAETPGSMNLAAENGVIFDSPITERQVGADTFFLASDFQEAGFAPTRFALAGCQASAPGHVRGEFRRCSGGEADIKGSFEAVRVTRLAGEAEASGVTLVSELALPLGVVPMNLFIANGHAYVTALGDGLFVFDVRDPAAPKQLVAVPSRGDIWRQVWVKDQTLYIASEAEGLLLYDVSTPASPKRLTSLPGAGFAVSVWGLYLEQDRLYAVSPVPRAEVLIYNVTTPASPTLLSRYIVEDSLPEEGENPVEAAALGNQLYIAHWRYGLAVAGVKDPKLPEKLGRYSYASATSRSVAVGEVGGRPVVFESSEGWGSSVRALDVEDPSNIKELGRFTLRPESTVSGLTLMGTKLYVAHNQDGLRVLDVSDPNTLRQAGWYNSWRETDPGRGRFFLDGLGDVKVPGDGLIYATDTSRGLLIFRELP